MGEFVKCRSLLLSCRRMMPTMTQCPYSAPPMESMPLEDIFGHTEPFPWDDPTPRHSQLVHPFSSLNPSEDVVTTTKPTVRVPTTKSVAFSKRFPPPEVEISCRQRRSSNSPFEGKSDWKFPQMGKSRQLEFKGLRAQNIARVVVRIFSDGPPQLLLSGSAKITHSTVYDIHYELKIEPKQEDADQIYLFVAIRPNTKIKHTVCLTLIDKNDHHYTGPLLTDVRAAGHKYASGQRVKERQNALVSNILHWRADQGLSCQSEELT